MGFDIKRTGIFQARLVACGYSQIPGVDFQDYYSPVVNDAVFRIVIILQILWKLTSVIVDVETAFLHGEHNESMYMLPPKGTNIGPNQCVHLDKALYGLVQAAQQFYIKFANVLKDLRIKVSYADPCLFHRHDKHGRIILVIHIDDCYVVGDRQAIKLFIKELSDKGLKTKVSPGANDYLCCEVLVDYTRQIGWIGQPTLFKNLEQKFGSQVNKMGEYQYKSPGTPGFLLVKSDNPEEQLSKEDQTLYLIQYHLDSDYDNFWYEYYYR
jgi:Reverse transcriptase (RNA-dependent DNA polymerase)